MGVDKIIVNSRYFDDSPTTSRDIAMWVPPADSASPIGRGEGPNEDLTVFGSCSWHGYEIAQIIRKRNWRYFRQQRFNQCRYCHVDSTGIFRRQTGPNNHSEDVLTVLGGLQMGGGKNDCNLWKSEIFLMTAPQPAQPWQRGWHH